MMLSYVLETDRKIPLYQQLYQAIREDIEAGTLPSDQRLPSKRAFAAHLQISVVTVENAYRQLVAEGYVYARPQRGFFVAQLPPSRWQFPSAAPDLGGYTSTRRGVRTKTAAIKPDKHDDVTGHKGEISAHKNIPVGRPEVGRGSWKTEIDLTGATSTGYCLPYSTWAKALRSTLSKQPEEQLLQAASYRGTRTLREAISNYLYGNRGLLVDPEQIVVAAGAQTLYQLIIQLLGRDLTYGLEDPGYPRLSQIYRSWQLPLQYLPLDSQGVNPVALQQSAVDVLHLMPSHQYPTGLVTSIGRRYELLEWASQAPRRYLIEDDYDCEIRYQGRLIPSLFSVDSGEQVIYTNTFTNTLGGAFRLAYMILPDSLNQVFACNLSFYSNTVSVLEQLALATLLDNGQFQRHLNRLRSHYRQISNRLRAAFWQVNREVGEEMWQLNPVEAGMHVSVRYLGNKLSEAELLKRLHDSGVKIHSLRHFQQKPQTNWGNDTPLWGGEISESCAVAPFNRQKKTEHHHYPEEPTTPIEGSESPRQPPVLLINFTGLTSTQIEQLIPIMIRISR